MAQDAGERTTEQRRTSPQADARAVAGKTLSAVASLIRLACVVIAAILVVHIVLALIPSTNASNPISQFFASAASALTLGFGTLFVPVQTPLNIILDYGIPAVVWIIIGIVASKILSALAP